MGDTQFHKQDESKKTFVEFLKSWKGEWMWNGLRLTEDPSWVAECLKNKILVCVPDGSYNKQVAPDVCSAGWVMACTQTKRQILGILIERSAYAGKYHNTISDGNKVCCDNKGALLTFVRQLVCLLYSRTTNGGIQ